MDAFFIHSAKNECIMDKSGLPLCMIHLQNYLMVFNEIQY